VSPHPVAYHTLQLSGADSFLSYLEPAREVLDVRASSSRHAIAGVGGRDVVIQCERHCSGTPCTTRAIALVTYPRSAEHQVDEYLDRVRARVPDLHITGRLPRRDARRTDGD